MHRNVRLAASLALVVLGAASAAALGADKAALDAAFAELVKYDWGADRAPLNTIEQAVVASHGDAAARKDLEKRLDAALGGEAKQAGKQFVCRQLSLIGTADSVPALAALLPDKDLSHMARYALERMPCPEAVAAMRAALPKAAGLQKVGIINSLGVRRDEQAVDALLPLLKDADAQIAAAAAASLGRIGSPKAIAPLAELRRSPPKGLQVVVFDASLDLAAALLKAGNKAEAEKIYTELNADNQPPAVRKAAFQGLVAVRPGQSTPMLMKALSGTDEAMRGLALRLIRETPGEEATKAFAAELSKLPAAGQAAMIDALGARGDAAARDAIVASLKSPDAKVKLAALKALGSVGNASDAAVLIAAMSSAAAGEAPAATASLTQLKGDAVNRAIVAAIPSAKPAVKAALLSVLSARAAREAAADIAKCAGDADPAVAAAAVDALGLLGSAEQLAALIEAAKAAKDDHQRTNVQTAVIAVCGRDGAKCEPILLGSLKDVKMPARGVLLAGLARIGGPKALAAVKADAASADAEAKDAAIRILAEWPDAAAADDLLIIASGPGDNVHRVLALRGYIRLARSADEAQRLGMLKKAKPLATQVNEQKLLLGALGTCPSAEALQIVLPDLDKPALVNEAAAAATQIGGKLPKDHAALVRQAMTKVIENVKDRRSRARRDAEQILGRLGPKP